jgi:hypothetical protein
MFNKVRSQLQIVKEEIMGRLGNMMVPLQQIIITTFSYNKERGLPTSKIERKVREYSRYLTSKCAGISVHI